LQNLKLLILINTKVTKAGATQLKSVLPKCDIFMRF